MLSIAFWERIWEITNSQVQEIGHLQLIGNQVWAGSFSGSIYIFDSESKELTKEIPGAHKKKINTFADTGSTVWSGSADGIICVWSKTDYQVVFFFFF